ncbi:PP0621 family protein [Roseateles koreensis]|uniref:PP0621 family protein n=1 Tax=Roseateles koreensis TaxID=2987526 RepID=A0ABT5KMW6_9BURK|nr:PP0621 family protein [Roseateles koreensis]MDC8784224.1 PP0621 family protein [Roseateles koreensis]
MKFLLLIALLALVFFLLGKKQSRPPSSEGSARPVPGPVPPQAMVSCARCGVHLPSDDALPGKGGMFCSAAHRAAFEAEQARNA